MAGFRSSHGKLCSSWSRSPLPGNKVQSPCASWNSIYHCETKECPTDASVGRSREQNSLESCFSLGCTQQIQKYVLSPGLPFPVCFCKVDMPWNICIKIFSQACSSTRLREWWVSGETLHDCFSQSGTVGSLCLQLGTCSNFWVSFKVNSTWLLLLTVHNQPFLAW